MKKLLENLFLVGVLVFILGFVYIKSEPKDSLVINETINEEVIIYNTK